MESIVTYPGQAQIPNVQDVLFKFTDPDRLEMQWTGFGNSYKIGLRKGEDFTNLGEVTVTQLAYTGALEKGGTYEFEFVTKDGNGRETAPETHGYTIPVDEPGPTSVKLERETATAVRISWNGDKEKIYMIGYSAAEGPDRSYKVKRTNGNTILLDGLLPHTLYDFVIGKQVGNYLILYTESLLQA